jgi:hypothetical protein
MPVGDEARLRRRRREVLMDGIDHDEVVAGAVHFAEADFHGARW